MGPLRAGPIVVLFCIGGLKFADYEADGILPLVGKSSRLDGTARPDSQTSGGISRRVPHVAQAGVAGMAFDCQIALQFYIVVRLPRGDRRRRELLSGASKMDTGWPVGLGAYRS